MYCLLDDTPKIKVRNVEEIMDALMLQTMSRKEPVDTDSDGTNADVEGKSEQDVKNLVESEVVISDKDNKISPAESTEKVPSSKIEEDNNVRTKSK